MGGISTAIATPILTGPGLTRSFTRVKHRVDRYVAKSIGWAELASTQFYDGLISVQRPKTTAVVANRLIANALNHGGLRQHIKRTDREAGRVRHESKDSVVFLFDPCHSSSKLPWCQAWLGRVGLFLSSSYMSKGARKVQASKAGGTISCTGTTRLCLGWLNSAARCLVRRCENQFALMS